MSKEIWSSSAAWYPVTRGVALAVLITRGVVLVTCGVASGGMAC
ncbi:hypothetical protein A2U01_0052469, partial [Trifolium medium]|nr:hypothetical protein [Trifolium medium]